MSSPFLPCNLKKSNFHFLSQYRRTSDFQPPTQKNENYVTRKLPGAASVSAFEDAFHRLWRRFTAIRDTTAMTPYEFFHGGIEHLDELEATAERKRQRPHRPKAHRHQDRPQAGIDPQTFKPKTAEEDRDEDRVRALAHRSPEAYSAYGDTSRNGNLCTFAESRCNVLNRLVGRRERIAPCPRTARSLLRSC